MVDTNNSDKKKLKNQLKKKLKKKLNFLDILDHIHCGKKPADIAKELDIPMANLQYHLRKLKKRGYIEKVSYGQWKVLKEVKKSTRHQLKIIEEQIKKNKVRGHAFAWKIKLPKIPDWDKREELLRRRNISYEIIGNLGTPRIIFENRKIWLGNKHLIIYDEKGTSYFAENAIESQKQAFQELIYVLRKIESHLGINLKFEGSKYQFKVFKQHYALVKDALAKLYHKYKKNLEVYDEKGMWMVIDNSFNLEELETVHTETAVPDNMGVAGVMNSHKRTDYKITAEYITENLNKQIKVNEGILKNLDYYGKHIVAHTKAMIKLADGIDTLIGLKIGNQPKKKIKRPRYQSTLGDFNI